jgi:hypothetical protein
MRIPFRFRPSFNKCFYAEEASLGSDVGGGSPAADSVIAGQTDSSTVGETFGAQPQTEGEQVAGSVTAPDGQQAAPDIFEGIPSLEELQRQAEQKVPGSEGLLRLRTELERVKPLAQQFESFKPIVENYKPESLQERLQVHESIFSPKLVNGQLALDERQLPLTTAHPFIEQMETKRPGFAMDHLLDVLDYQTVVDPTTGQKETLASQFVKHVLGLDISRLEQYQNIDTLIAKSNGNISPEELNQIPETDRDAYKTLPARIRQDFSEMDEEERRYHLDGAKERLESRQFREQQRQAQEQAQQQEREQFEAQVQQDFVQDLATVRETAFGSLRDNLAKVWQPSTDDAINQDRYDDVLAPLVHLIDPDLQPMALKRLEREGVKVNAQEFNQEMSTLVKARETMVRAKAYGDALNADRAEQDFNRLHTKMMAKFNTIALQRAARYGYQAKQIAEKKGELLTAASAVRLSVPGSTMTPGEQRLDPRSDAAIMRDWNASRPSA